jgi:hypothetical protein
MPKPGSEGIVPLVIKNSDGLGDTTCGLRGTNGFSTFGAGSSDDVASPGAGGKGFSGVGVGVRGRLVVLSGCSGLSLERLAAGDCVL